MAPSHNTSVKGRWTDEQTEAFIKATLEIGAGKWAEIKHHLDSPRTSTQLKDKWRDLGRSKIRRVAQKYGLTYQGPKT